MRGAGVREVGVSFGFFVVGLLKFDASAGDKRKSKVEISAMSSAGIKVCKRKQKKFLNDSSSISSCLPATFIVVSKPALALTIFSGIIKINFPKISTGKCQVCNFSSSSMAHPLQKSICRGRIFVSAFWKNLTSSFTASGR